MKKHIILLLGAIIFLSVATAFFIRGGETIATQPMKDPMSFQLVDESSLSDLEKAFVLIAKEYPGVHRFGSLYVISLGQKPHPGYRIELTGQKQILEQVKLYIRQLLPEKGKMYAQVIVYPHLVGRIELPKYTTLSVLDAETKKPVLDQTGFKLEFHDEQVAADTRKAWTIPLDHPISQSELSSYKITLKKMDGMELPVTTILERDNQIKVIPNEPYEIGVTYLLQIVHPKGKETNMAVWPFKIIQ